MSRARTLGTAVGRRRARRVQIDNHRHHIPHAPGPPVLHRCTARFGFGVMEPRAATLEHPRTVRPDQISVRGKGRRFHGHRLGAVRRCAKRRCPHSQEANPKAAVVRGGGSEHTPRELVAASGDAAGLRPPAAAAACGGQTRQVTDGVGERVAVAVGDGAAAVSDDNVGSMKRAIEEQWRCRGTLVVAVDGTTQAGTQAAAA
jgi:hypothetical protein